MDYPVSKKIMAAFHKSLDREPRSREELKAILKTSIEDLCSILNDAEVNRFTDEIDMMMRAAHLGNPPRDILPDVVFGVLEGLKKQQRLIDFTAADALIDVDSFETRVRDD